jgi:hypothetical protein
MQRSTGAIDACGRDPAPFGVGKLFWIRSQQRSDRGKANSFGLEEVSDFAEFDRDMKLGQLFKNQAVGVSTCGHLFGFQGNGLHQGEFTFEHPE